MTGYLTRILQRGAAPIISGGTGDVVRPMGRPAISVTPGSVVAEPSAEVFEIEEQVVSAPASRDQHTSAPRATHAETPISTPEPPPTVATTASPALPQPVHEPQITEAPISSSEQHNATTEPAVAAPKLPAPPRIEFENLGRIEPLRARRDRTGAIFSALDETGKQPPKDSGMLLSTSWSAATASENERGISLKPSPAVGQLAREGRDNDTQLAASSGRAQFSPARAATDLAPLATADRTATTHEGVTEKRSAVVTKPIDEVLTVRLDAPIQKEVIVPDVTGQNGAREARTPQITIGRLEVQVVNQPPSPPQPQLVPNRRETESHSAADWRGVDRHYLGRYYLTL